MVYKLRRAGVVDDEGISSSLFEEVGDGDDTHRALRERDEVVAKLVGRHRERAADRMVARRGSIAMLRLKALI